jgi:hypothetical protein
MSHVPRTRPLEAAAAEPSSESSEPMPSGARSVLVGVAIGLAVGVAGVAIAFSIVAIPLFIVASTEPGSGLNRDLVRMGLFKIALPVGVVAGVAAGTLVGIWYARGGRLPTDRTPLEL